MLPFVSLVDTQEWQGKKFGHQDSSMIKCFTYDSGKNKISKEMCITAANFGPYDNGHIVVGFNTGLMLILNSFDLAAMFRIQVFDIETPISSIVFDPTQMIFASSATPSQQDTLVGWVCPILRFNLCGITLIERQASYKYIDMGQDTFMTLVIPKESSKVSNN